VSSPPATQVVIRRNDPARGVTNGDRGTIVAVDSRRHRIDLDNQWLVDRRQTAAAHVLPVAEDDFIVPGMAADGHFSLNEHKKWGSRYFRPAAEAVAREHLHLAHLARATPYSARRGHITCRILARELVEEIARSCGISPTTIHRHYYVASDATPAYVGQWVGSPVAGSFTGTCSSGPPVEGERHPWMRSPRRSMSRYLATRLARVSGRLASLMRQMIE
jgi:hypothetical protein